MWTGPARRIRLHRRGDVRGLKVTFITSPRVAAPKPGSVLPALAVRPGIVTRGMARQRVDPPRRADLRARAQDGVRPPHRYRHVRAVLGLRPDRPRHLRLSRAHERLERHRLQLPRRQVRHRVRGPLRRHDEAGDRRPDEGVQHRLGRHRGHRDVQLRAPAPGRRRGARAPDRLAARHRVCRPGVAGRDGVVGEPALPDRPARCLQCRLRASRRLPDVVPGFRALRLLPRIRAAARSIGDPKIWGPTHRQSLHRIAPDAVLPLELRAKFSKRMAFTLTIRRPDGRVVARAGTRTVTSAGPGAAAPRCYRAGPIGGRSPRRARADSRGRSASCPCGACARRPTRSRCRRGRSPAAGSRAWSTPTARRSTSRPPADPQTELVTDFGLDNPACRARRYPRGGERRHDGGRACRRRALGLRLELVGRHRLVHLDAGQGVQGREPGRRPRVRELGRLVVRPDARPLHVPRRRRRRLGARAPQGLTSTATTSSAVCATPATTSRPAPSTPSQRPSSPPARLTRRPRRSSRSRPGKPSRSNAR